ncbi:MAG: alpha/beta fold hydrolase, partial [Caulobacteraceae bacterium]
MARFNSGGLSLAYDDIRPAGEEAGVIMLVHGFATSRTESWRRLGWYAAFERKGWRVIAPDLRGHGESEKPHEASAYARADMAGDLVALMDHLGVSWVNLMGYSMGAHLALGLALRQPELIGHLILGGVGARVIDGASPFAKAGMTMADAMRVDDADSIADGNLR